MDPIVARILQLDKANERTVEDEAERDRLQSQRHREQMGAIPRLTCCPESRRFFAIVFDVVPDDDLPSDQWRGRWYIRESERLGEHRRMQDENWHKVTTPEPRFCPFCATPVPKMRRKEPPPENVCRVDDGYYCATCKYRLQACYCLPPVAAFEPEPG